MAPTTALQLADWRRAVAELYAAVRAEPDPAAAHASWRRGRDGLFANHPQSPLGRADPLRRSGLPCWPYDPAMRFEVPVTPAAAAQRIEVDTGADGVTRYELIGTVRLPAPLSEELALWWTAQYGGGLFLPVRDGTAGDTSYGGGRYLLDTTKGADLGGTGDLLVVDLNFLYHPSCRYDDRWVCPLAPAQNTIAARIRAGERI